MSEDEKIKSNYLQQSLANERTFLAWVRTCIALIGLGFIIAKFGLFIEELKLVLSQSVSEITKTPITSMQSKLLSDDTSSLVGIGIVIISIVLILFALRNYYNISKEIRYDKYTPKHTIMYTTVIVFIAMSLAIIFYLYNISIQI
jgi:putative membrane protein